MNDEEFYEWYQKPLIYLLIDEGSLTYLFSNFGDGPPYNHKWAQKSLDFAYRVLKSEICKIVWDNPDNDEILLKLSKSDPDTSKDYYIWQTYQIYLSDYGEEFLKECGVNDYIEYKSIGYQEGLLPIFKEKLTALFEKHDVGFDKSNFIPVQF